MQAQLLAARKRQSRDDIVSKLEHYGAQPRKDPVACCGHWLKSLASHSE